MNKKIIEKFLLSAMGGFAMTILFVIGCIFLIIYAFSRVEDGSSYRAMKSISAIIIGAIGLYMALPACIALAKNIALLIADLVSPQTFSVALDLNRSTKENFPRHTFHVIYDFKRILPIPFGMFWALAFSRSYYLLSETTFRLDKNRRYKPSTRVIASKYAHVIVSVENRSESVIAK